MWRPVASHTFWCKSQLSAQPPQQEGNMHDNLVFCASGKHSDLDSFPAKTLSAADTCRLCAPSQCEYSLKARKWLLDECQKCSGRGFEDLPHPLCSLFSGLN